MVLGLVAVLVPSALIPAGATASTSVNFTLEGCRNNGNVTLPNIDGDFICPDSAYTTGNLGKGWNELDLVPYRLTADAGTSAPATQTYDLAIVLDNEDAGRPGYDVLSVPVLNERLSDDSCSAPAVGGQEELIPGLGGADVSIYRIVTITQLADTTCVYDYYGRLALGSHRYPGSSLHANLANEHLGTAGIGSKEVSIPVREIKPQELRKDMLATQGTGNVWNVTKTATPANVTFDQTCTDIVEDLSRSVSINVTWTRLQGPDGEILVVTNIYAENPASRTITVNVSDQIYSGTTEMGAAVSSGPVPVPANSEVLVLTHSTTVPTGTENLNDIATATYTDLVTGIAVPGTTTATATASVQDSGEATNETATITDVESISGSGFSYSVDSLVLDSGTGSFAGGYVAGTKTTAPVSWSTSQSDSGSVTFAKTVYATKGVVDDGSLSDTATLLGSSGFTMTAQADVALSASASVSLTIDKTIPDVLTGDETASFAFDVFDAEGVLVADSRRTIDFSAGDTTGSAAVSGLAPGTYTVHEVADSSGQWATQADKIVTIRLPDCAGSVAFNNTPNPLGISLDKKVNGADHATSGDALLVHSGDALTYDVVVTNTGLVPLTITSLADTLRDPGFDGTCTQGIGSVLEPGASFTCTYPMTAAGDATNVATVGGVDSLGRDVTASDSTFVDVINPAIQVVKTVDDESPEVGQTVTYTYVVTNTGDTTLSDVTVVDDVLGAIGTIGTLASGASATLTRAVVVTAGTPSRNVALATGTDVLGKQVTDDDDAVITVTEVLGIVAEQAPQPRVLPAVLPRTGMAIGGILLLGFALLFGGLTLRSARRRPPVA
jgi:uncharacterized repeat protein (TIGR01451 family)